MCNSKQGGNVMVYEYDQFIERHLFKKHIINFIPGVKS